MRIVRYLFLAAFLPGGAEFAQEHVHGGTPEARRDSRPSKASADVRALLRDEGNALSTLRGLSDGVSAAAGDRVDRAVAAAERTLGASVDLAGSNPEEATPPRRGGCGGGGSSHRGH